MRKQHSLHRISRAETPSFSCGPPPVQPQIEHSLSEQIPVIAAEEAPAIELYDESLPQEIDGADFEPPRVLRRMVE